jgi:tetratricopeptide (TPR) repeat protein/tRNA A-37 threonylcarbamoyl transferase component Bud32
VSNLGESDMVLDPHRIKALFNAALDLPLAADRPAFLDRECGTDRELRHRVEELLAGYDRPASALGQPLAAGPSDVTSPFCASDQSAGEAPATATSGSEGTAPALVIGTLVAGRFKLRQEIAEGGMGTVYLAEQQQPVKRKVALKLIKAGMDSKTVLARFESERQALALMDHPNIAKVLDAGTTEHGRPFFVMELVKGIPLIDYCDQHRLGIPERLTLFRQICSAVQHAHQKGIIHRDLKPSNILVESHDGLAVPRVIDFGLAKAISGLQLSEHSLYSAFGSVTGTPLYMAPEQASFNALDIDTRADVYSLGVILYELLAGSTPIARDTIRRAALDEMLRVIREDEPPTPSSRISTSEALPTIAASRQIEPARLSRLVRGDLDWIVMKALSKERQRRYETAIALAQDVERYTNHEPVSAGPPGAVYRFKKFVRRNRPQVIAASLVLLALVAGVVGTTLGLLEARRQARIAVGEAKAKEEARKAEALQRQQAEIRSAQIEKSNEILGSIFKDLDPRTAEREGKPLAALLGERLNQATVQIEGEAIGDPLVVARMQETLGKSHAGLGHYDKAIALFTKVRATRTAQLGLNHPDTLESMHSLASAYVDAEKLDLALPLCEETLMRMRDLHGPDYPGTTAGMVNLAGLYVRAGKFDRALPLLEEVFNVRKARLGSDHKDTLASMGALAYGYREAGKLDRALPLMEEALPLFKAKFGPDHYYTLMSMGNLGLAYFDVEKPQRALPLFEERYKLTKAKLGPDHPQTLRSMNDLALGNSGVGKHDRALQLFEETLAQRKSILGRDHPDTLVSMNNLAAAYRSVGELARALPLFEETLAITKARRGPEHPHTLMSMNNLAQTYQADGNVARALALYEECFAIMKLNFGPDHPSRLITATNLGHCYLAAGQPDRALTLFRELADRLKHKSGADTPEYASALALLGATLLKEKKWAEAEPDLHAALEIREAREPDAWRTCNTKAMLGAALLGQKKYADAGPLLKAGYEGLKQRVNQIEPENKFRLADAIDRLIDLATATGNAGDLKTWQDEKAKLPAMAPPKPEAARK